MYKRKTIIYEVITEQGHKYFTKDRPALQMYVDAVGRRASTSINRIEIKRTIFGKQTTQIKNIRSFGGAQNV